MKRRFLGTTVLLAALAALLSSPALAQPAWPTRPVRVITPQPPGTGIDLSCRFFAQKLSLKWNQPVVVENRPGADGVTGVGAFANAGNDHTLLCSFGGPITISPFTAQAKLPSDPATDLKPLSLIAWRSLIVSSIGNENSVASAKVWPPARGDHGAYLITG